MAKLLHANAAVSCPHVRHREPVERADAGGGKRAVRRRPFQPVGNHRMPVHGRHRAAAVRDDSMDYRRGTGVRARE